MADQQTFLWHDYETTGADPARDRPAQFAAIRTNAELEVIGAPLMFYCQPVVDVLPTPGAALITGITPQVCQRDGLPEPEFARRIHAAFSEPGTCGVGYNSIRFDDEVTRHLLYRNFYDPYEIHWRGGNSRWDLLDVMRLWHALRPEGFNWPKREDGATSFRLQHLTAANGLSHEQAHEALSDVEATIALARALKAQQPRLWAHALKLRDKKFAASLLDVSSLNPVLHVSSKIPAQRGCLAVIAPLAWHLGNSNQVITFDLSHEVDALFELDVDELQERVFASDADLPEGLTRIPLKGVHTNKSPMLAPLATLDAASAARWDVDLARIKANHARLLTVREQLAEKVQAVFAQRDYGESDAELSLYGGFASEADKARMLKVRAAAPETLAHHQGQFTDARYNELLLRYRARNFPHTLDEAERNEWLEFVSRKLRYDTGLASLTLPTFHEQIESLLAQATELQQHRILQSLKDWPMDSGLDDLLREAA